MLGVRKTTPADIDPILALYRTVATQSGGIIRTEEEITRPYVEAFVTGSLRSGVGYVVDHPGQAGVLVAEIHAYPYGLSAFRHILTDLTIVVHPAFQGQRIGKLIFERLLTEVAENMPHILRLELFVRENNARAIQFYQKLGFIQEGRHKHKIKNKDNALETPLEMTWFNPNYRMD